MSEGTHTHKIGTGNGMLITKATGEEYRRRATLYLFMVMLFRSLNLCYTTFAPCFFCCAIRGHKEEARTGSPHKKKRGKKAEKDWTCSIHKLDTESQLLAPIDKIHTARYMPIMLRIILSPERCRCQKSNPWNVTLTNIFIRSLSLSLFRTMSMTDGQHSILYPPQILGLVRAMGVKRWMTLLGEAAAAAQLLSIGNTKAR